MRMKQLVEKWRQLDRRTKILAFGTGFLVSLSICLPLGSHTLGHNPTEKAATTVKETAITEGAGSRLLSDEEMQAVESLTRALSSEKHLWRNPDDELWSIHFTEQGYDEYYGDIQTSCIWEFYEIEVTSNGWSGIWRIEHADGTSLDASFTFTHDSKRNVYTIASPAFQCGTYETAL